MYLVTIYGIQFRSIKFSLISSLIILHCMNCVDFRVSFRVVGNCLISRNTVDREIRNLFS